MGWNANVSSQPQKLRTRLCPVQSGHEVVLGNPLAVLVLPHNLTAELVDLHFNLLEIHPVLDHEVLELLSWRPAGDCIKKANGQCLKKIAYIYDA